MSSKNSNPAPKKQTQSEKKNASKRKQSRRDPVTPAMKKLPDAKYNVGDANSNSKADVASNVTAATQTTAMTGTQNTVLLSDLLANSKVYQIARVLALKACANLPGDSTGVDSASNWTPAGLVMNLVWALFDSFKNAGYFQNAAIASAFPAFPASADIPVAWAQVIQYLKPYIQGSASSGFDDSNNTFTALPAAPANASIGPNGTSFCLDANTVAGLTLVATSGVENSISLGAAPTWANIWTCQPFHSNVWSRAMSTTKYGLIPKYAPDASAYAIFPTAIGLGLNCWTPNFNPEIAYLLAAGTTSATYGGLLGYTKPAPSNPGQLRASFWFVETFQLCAFLPGKRLKDTLRTHTWNQAKFADRVSPHGRVRVNADSRAEGFGKQPIRFLFGNTIPIDTHGMQSLIAAILATGAPALSWSNEALYCMQVVCISAVIAKLVPFCYHPTGSTVINLIYDPGFMNVDLPLPFAAVLNTLGPIAVDGRMHYPYLWTNATDVRGHYINASVLGLCNNALEFYGGSFVGQTVSPANPQNLIIGNFTCTAAMAGGTLTNVGLTPLASSTAFIQKYLSSLSPAGPGAPLIALVKPDSHNPVGKSNQLVFADSSLAVVANNVPSLVGGTLGANLRTVTQVGSYKDVVGDELGAAIICPVVYPISQGGSMSSVTVLNPPYRAASSNSARTSLLYEFAAACNTQEVGSALSTALGMVKRETYEVNGNTVDVSESGDLFGAIVDKIVAPLFGDGIASTLKGSPLGKVASFTTPLALGGPVLLAADKLGIVDGVVSSFGLSKNSPKPLHPSLRKLDELSARGGLLGKSRAGRGVQRMVARMM